MDETILKYRLSKMILFFGVVFMVVLMILFAMGGFTQGELVTLLGLALPMVLLYLTAILKYAYQNRYIGPGKPVPSIFSFLSTYVLIFLFGLMLVLVALKALINLMSFETLKLVLIAIQSGFAIYGGFIITELFSGDAAQD